MKKFVPPFSETNSLPSVATFEPVSPDSVRSRLPEQNSTYSVNGHNLRTLREMSAFSKIDDLDRFGVASHMLAEGAARWSKSGLYSKFIQSINKNPK